MARSGRRATDLVERLEARHPRQAQVEHHRIDATDLGQLEQRGHVGHRSHVEERIGIAHQVFEQHDVARVVLDQDDPVAHDRGGRRGAGRGERGVGHGGRPILPDPQRECVPHLGGSRVTLGRAARRARHREDLAHRRTGVGDHERPPVLLRRGVGDA